jgi:hypothetical protein
MSFNLSWSFGNGKVSKLGAVSFGIPAYRSAGGFATCPQAGACAAVCYARQGRYLMPNVAGARERNLESTRRPDFAAMAIVDLGAISARLVRVHDSGDFYSQAYLDAWFEVARAFPGKTFYAYTKSLHLDFSGVPDNFRIVQSEGGKLDAGIDRGRPHSRIFVSHAARRKAGYGDGSNTDTLAVRGARKIGLVYHGSRSLTPAQEEFFS